MESQNFSTNALDSWEVLATESRILSPAPRKSLSLEFMDDLLSTASTNSGNSDSIKDLAFFEQPVDSEVPNRASNPIIFDRKFSELEANSWCVNRQCCFGAARFVVEPMAISS